MIAPQRLMLHQHIARSLEEQYAKRLEEHAAELAEHFSQSTDPGDLIKAVEYGKMAAKRASSVYAYGEAARLLEQALKVQRIIDPDDKANICDLLLELSSVSWFTGGHRHSLDEELPEAFALAEALGDRTRASLACTLAVKLYGLGAVFSQEAWARPEAATWLERADHYAEPGTVGRAWADQGMGYVKCLTNYYSPQPQIYKEGMQLLDRASELALRLDDIDAFWHIPAIWINYAYTPQYARRRRELAEQMAGRLSSCPNPVTLILFGSIWLESGLRVRFEECCNYLKSLSERTRLNTTILMSMRADSILAALDGRFEEALEIAQNIETRGKEFGIPEFASVWVMITKIMPLIRLGRTDELLRGPLNIPSNLIKVWCQGKPGSDVEVSEILEKLVVARPGIGTVDDHTAVYSDAIFLEVAVLVGHRPTAELLLKRLSGYSLPFTYQAFLTCIPRHLGGAAALLGRYDEARQYYQEAIRVCTELRFRPELALTRLQLAELLLEHYPAEKKEALEHLDFAIKEFREMKMQPSLERALRHKDILKA